MSANFTFKANRAAEGENITVEISRVGDLSQRVTYLVSSVLNGNINQAKQAWKDDVETVTNKAITFEPGMGKQSFSLQTYKDTLAEGTEIVSLGLTPVDDYPNWTSVTGPYEVLNIELSDEPLPPAPEPVAPPVVAPLVQPQPSFNINGNNNVVNFGTINNYTYNITTNTTTTNNTNSGNTLNTTNNVNSGNTTYNVSDGNLGIFDAGRLEAVFTGTGINASQLTGMLGVA